MLPVPHPEVIYKALEEGSILFHCTDEVYFGLNRVGARVWELLPSVNTMDELSAAVAAEYPDAPADAIRTDVAELLNELSAQGLLRPPTGAGPAGAS